MSQAVASQLRQFIPAANAVAAHLGFSSPRLSVWQVVQDNSASASAGDGLEGAVDLLNLEVGNGNGQTLRLLGGSIGGGIGIGLSPVDIEFNGEGPSISASNAGKMAVDAVGMNIPFLGPAFSVDLTTQVTQLAPSVSDLERLGIDIAGTTLLGSLGEMAFGPALVRQILLVLPNLPGTSAIFLGPRGVGLSGPALFGGLALTASASGGAVIAAEVSVTLFCDLVPSLSSVTFSEAAFPLLGPAGALVSLVCLDAKAFMIQVGLGWSTDVGLGADLTVGWVSASPKN